jgi:hypothetical protein
LAVAVLATAVLGLAAAPRPAPGQPSQMPEFPPAAPDRWLNSTPLALKDLRGQVVLIEIWTST